MKSTPLISFIITYHNEPEALLRACIGSIQALRVAEGEAEIIVVDDGSEVPLSLLRWEGTAQDSGFKIQNIRQEQSGLSVARNTGINQSHGRYIQFVDADDCLVPSAYEAVLALLREEAADVVMFRMTSRGKGQEDVRCAMYNAQSSRSLTPSDFLLHHNLRAAACAYVFRRDVLGELRFYSGLFHEDELFTPQLFLRAKSLVEMDIKAYFYRLHEGTITHSKSPGQIQKRLDDIRFVIKELYSLNERLLERKIRQLTVDYLQKTWTLTHSFRELHRRSAELCKEGFLPLPLRRYSLRYLFVAMMARFF